MKGLMKETRQLAKEVIEQCIARDLRMVAAESMTGGLLMAELTSIPDASKVIEKSYIVYSEQAKIDVLCVPKEVIETETAYSKKTVESMIQGLNKLSKANIKIAISGIAGPKAFVDLDVGTVFIGIDINNQLFTYKKHFDGDRQSIRYETIKFVFEVLMNYFSKKEG